MAHSVGIRLCADFTPGEVRLGFYDSLRQLNSSQSFFFFVYYCTYFMYKKVGRVQVLHEFKFTSRTFAQQSSMTTHVQTSIVANRSEKEWEKALVLQQIYHRVINKQTVETFMHLGRCVSVKKTTSGYAWSRYPLVFLIYRWLAASNYRPSILRIICVVKFSKNYRRCIQTSLYSIANMIHTFFARSFQYTKYPFLRRWKLVYECASEEYNNEHVQVLGV